MITRNKYLFIILLLTGIPILFQASGVAELREAVSVMAVRPGPNLYLQKNDRLKPVPKYSLVRLSDGREGLYLWVYEDEVHLELNGDAGKAVVSQDQISQIVIHDVNVPVAAIGVGLVIGAVVLNATRTSEIVWGDYELITTTETVVTETGDRFQVEVTESRGTGFDEVFTYYPESAIAAGALSAVTGGFLARMLKKRSTFTIGNNGWQLSIVNNLE